jgi:hypothetical protein
MFPVWCHLLYRVIEYPNIEDTQNIHFSRNQETLTQTAILGINKTLHTDTCTFLMYFLSGSMKVF